MVIEQLDCFVLGLAQYRFGTVYVFSEPSMLYHKFDLSTWLKKNGTNASRSGKRPEKTIKDSVGTYSWKFLKFCCSFVESDPASGNGELSPEDY